MSDASIIRRHARSFALTSFISLLTTFVLAASGGQSAAFSGTLSTALGCPPEKMPCLVLLNRGSMGGSIIPADFITSDTGLLSKLGRSFVVTIPANSDAPVEVGGMKLSPKQLDPSGKGGTFVFTYKSQKKDAKGNTVFSFNVARR